MAREMDWVLYDTQDWGTTASTLHNYFQSRENGSPTLTKFLTNMRGDGNLPQQESFLIHNIGVFFDDSGALADLLAFVRDSYIEITLSDKTIFQAPLRYVIAKNAWSGHFTQATPADLGLIGIKNDGYQLKMPIMIQGGVNFRVVLGQGTALAAGSMGVKVALQGILSLPD